MISYWSFHRTMIAGRNGLHIWYVIWLFVKRLSHEAIQRRSQRDRLVKIKVFKLRRDAGDIPCNITLRSAGGESFHSAGPTTEKARFWDREVWDQGISRSQRSAERMTGLGRWRFRHELTQIFR